MIKDREYAYGGHDRKGMSGVYWTKPRSEPPGGTFRYEIVQGFTFRSDEDIEEIIKEVSQSFQGTSYNLLSNNCNHFTSYLCEKLTSRPAPTWLNRAASIGIALPCVVPREWATPPDHDSTDGELLEDENDEQVAMLRNSPQGSNIRHTARLNSSDDESINDIDRKRVGKAYGRRVAKDVDGRELPASERAPQSDIH